jgi:tRNA(Ile)-lysidine synthase
MNATETVLGNILRFWKNHALPSNTTIIVGVSGGTDSLTLLHALCTLREQLGITLHVATLDHCLRGAEGASDADFVKQMAQDWGVSCTQGKTDVRQLVRDYGINLEEAARQARYSFFLDVFLGCGRRAWRGICRCGT